MLASDSNFKKKILQYMHNNLQASYSGYLKTYQRVKRDFYWKSMKRDIKQMVRECDTCQAVKYETSHPARLLQPLPIPQQPWTDISLDFIDGLPISKGFNVIFVVVDHFSKYAHFMALFHPYTAQVVAEEFLKNIFKLHRFPRSVVSDRDPIFLSSFWQALFHSRGSSLDFNLGNHPQIAGQTETLKKSIECYLRCYAGVKSKMWSQWLIMAKS